MGKRIQKLGAVLLTGVVTLSLAACNSSVPEENTSTQSNTQNTYADMPVKETDLSTSDPDYYQMLIENEIYNYKLIRNVPTAYETASWDTYCSAANILLTIDTNAIGDVQKQMIDKAVKHRKLLIQTNSAKDCMWYLWDKDMPSVEEDINSLEFTTSSYDNADFRPFLVPYILKDQNTVKGNMIIIAGGGYSSRGNAGEGYPIAQSFNELGYNCYVLQRRVTPYAPEDIWMDLQRSIRYIRYHGDAMGLGGLDCLISTGFSGGGMTITSTIAFLYGDILPTIYDSSYTPDEIDAMNSDMNVACVIYGPNMGKELTEYYGMETDNPVLPAFYLAAGANDSTSQDNIKLAETLKDKAIVEMHSFANVGHGFGVGLSGTNSTYWIPMADCFIDQVIGLSKPNAASVEVDLPEEYTQSQSYTATFGFGNADVTCAINDEGSKFYIYFTAFEDLQILEGIIDDGTVTVTYDKSGFMTNDAQMLVDLADPNGWKPIK